MLDGRHAAESGVRARLSFLGVEEQAKPAHLSDEQAQLRRGLRTKQRQLGGEFDVLVWDAAYEQWHRLLFARFLAENGLLHHPEFGAPVTLAECEELADDLGEPDGWSVAVRFAAEILPGLFRLVDPCVQLRLAPEHRAALEKIVAGLPKDVFVADDSLGWVYQYWQAERKNQVNASEEKIGGADLGPVTQLFTENYMVRFLLENSLGAWWAARHPDSPLIKDFEYLRFNEDGNPAAGSFDGWPEHVAEVTVMDPCCGSGHFLVEAFGMQWRMRVEEEGLDPITAQDAVLRTNLFGLELDPRCVQIAMFAVALTAWKQGGGWRALPTPNIVCSGIPTKAPLEEWTALARGDERLERALKRLHTLFMDAETLGSLIDPQGASDTGNLPELQLSFDDVDFGEVSPLLEMATAQEPQDSDNSVLEVGAVGVARAATLLADKYTLLITNVPYLSWNSQTVLLRDFVSRTYPDAKADLAFSFLQRLRGMSVHGGAVAAVLPTAWLTLTSYNRLRSKLLARDRWAILAWLGPRAFDAISGEVVRVCLWIGQPNVESSEAFAAWDVSELDYRGKAKGLICKPRILEVRRQARHPDERILFEPLGSDEQLLSEVATALTGLLAGDSQRFDRLFWEVASLGDDWERFQSTVSETMNYGGRSKIVFWQQEQGEMAALAESVKHRNHVAQNWRRGKPSWGKLGVVVSLMGDLSCTIYSGDRYDLNCCAIVPEHQEDLVALWAFMESGEFSRLVRLLDKSFKVTTKTLLKVPFGLERWREVAADRFPGGLPEPWSDDPTQWLFEGRPEEATEPLQVAVGRLIGYSWPDQPDSDNLGDFADDDGIVCLPAVGGELPAVDRLKALLAQVYGKDWSPWFVRQLLEQAGSKKNLAYWLRDDFFKQHCKVFSNRPFVWHIWDGRKDGFAALVNYHRSDRAGLEKLTYTYLGNWIERQRADAAEDVAGADSRLAAAKELKGKLEAILVGEKPYDIYVRWKGLHEQPIGWEPDLDDGVRSNIRPFVEAGVLRSKVNVHWKKDRGKNPDGSERHNDLHFTTAEKQLARQKARQP